MEKQNTLKDKLKNYINEINEEYKINNINNYDYDEDNKADLDYIEEWLISHFYCDEEFEFFKMKICVTIKDITTDEFINKFFDYSKLLPKRNKTTPLSYIIYKLSLKEDLEIYIANNLFVSTRFPRRKQENVILSNVLYVDIDQVKGSENLNYNSKDYNKQLLDLFYKNYEVSKIIPPSEIVASGSGLHLYFYIDTLFFNQENRFDYITVLKELTNLYNGDCNCVDCSRILRPIKTFNKKGKFTTPKQVEQLECKEIKYKLCQIEILILKCNEKLKPNTKQKIKKITPLQDGVKKVKSNKHKDDYFELQEYETYSNYPNQYLIQDLLYYLSNREGYIEGYRHNFIYCLYFSLKVYCLLENEQIETYIKDINQLFKKPLTEKELIDILKELSEYNFYNGITNIKVKEMLKFNDEEIIKMRGTYTSNSDERKQIKLERDRRISKQKYINKKPTKTIIINCILNNPEKSDIEIANLLNINRTTVYRHRKDLNK